MGLLEKLIETIILLLILLIIIFISRIILKKIIDKNQNKRSKTIASLSITIVRYLIFFVGVFTSLSIWGIDTNALVAGVGFMGLALGIGAKSLLEDMINGFFIIFENQFNIGDQISINGETGLVLDIGMKSTTLKTYDGRMIVISNGDIKTVCNHSRFASLAIVDFELSYENEISLVEEIINNYINDYHFENKMIIGKPNYLGVSSMTKTGIIYRITALSVPFEHFGVERFLRKNILEVFQKGSIKSSVYFISDEKNKKFKNLC